MEKLISAEEGQLPPNITDAINRICFEYFSKNYPAIVKLIFNMKARGFTLEAAQQTVVRALNQTNAENSFSASLKSTVDYIYNNNKHN